MRFLLYSGGAGGGRGVRVEGFSLFGRERGARGGGDKGWRLR